MYRSIKNMLLAGLAFLALVAAASGLPTVAVSTDTPWLTAGGFDAATVTVVVNDDVPGAQVVLSCDPEMGMVAPETLGGTGGTATFTAGTVSGSATITANYVAPNGTVLATNGTVVNIDHGTPYKLAFLDYESEATVGSEVPIVLAMVDKFGNLIDNRKETESVTFSVGSPGNSAVFVVGGNDVGDTVASPVDGNGNVTTILRLSRTAGENIVYADLPDPVADAYLTFYSISDAPPVSMTCDVLPVNGNPPWVYANGNSTFTLICTLEDAHGNPSANRSVLFTALAGEEKTLFSNADGQIMFTYGPRDSSRSVTITATSVDNASVNCSRTVEFISTAPVDMLLSASPQTMASQDVNSYQTAEMRAKVIDVKGNAVKGQTVRFSLSAIQTTGSDPTLRSTSAVTDEFGYATVLFEPGAFPGSYQNATGRCTITAVWTYEETSVTHTLPLTWMNYPYLSVATSVDPETVNVTGTVNVTLTLTGDGYKLRQRPVDAMLVIDRSGSMLYDTPDRMYSVREAAKEFIDNLSEGDDGVGLVTFGRNTGSRNQIDVPGECSFDRPRRYIDNTYNTPKRYLDYATVDLPLTTDDFSSVKTELDNIVPDYGTPMRAGLYKAIKELCGSGDSASNSDTVRAVVLLSDGDYNWYGDPLARGRGYSSSSYGPTAYGDLDRDYYKFNDLSNAEQNLSVYAMNNDITIYSIGYADDISSGGKNTLRQLAESTGGKYYDGDAANIDEIYTAIAGELKTEAGVNTTMDISFENVEVNGILVDGRDVLEYVYAPGESTVIESWIDNETGHYQAIPFHTEDQTPGPDDDLNLHFDIGTVHIGQTWTATYRLKVLAPGNIKLFGDGSTISFNNGTETLNLPDTFVTAVPDLNNTGIGTGYLWVSQPSRIGSGAITDFLQLTWNLNYTGDNTTTQRLFYSTDEKRTWVQFYTVDPRTWTDGVKSEEAALDVRDLPAAQYWIRVKAEAPDAAPAENETSIFFVVGGNSTKKIKLI